MICDGIHFRSKLEARIYRALQKATTNIHYEAERIKLWDRQKFSVPYYNRVGKKGFIKVTTKPLPIHYTPDFTFKYKGYTVYLEVKGYQNDVTTYKIRLFRDWLESYSHKTTDKLCYAVVHSEKDLTLLLKNLEESEKATTFAS